MPRFKAEFTGYGYAYVEAEDMYEADMLASHLDPDDITWTDIDTGHEFPMEA